MPRYAFLDRDGTLVPERPDDEWRGVTTLELLPGVGRALRSLQDAGYALVVLTNQYPIDEGLLTGTSTSARRPRSRPRSRPMA